MLRISGILYACAALAFGAGALGGQVPPEPGMLVSGAWLQERLGDPRILILHVDSRRDFYEQEHIPGSRFVALSSVPLLGGAGFEPAPVDTLDAALEAAGAGDDLRIVIAARSPLTATRLWLTLDYLGHGEHASILDGGTAGWKAEGRPLTADTPRVSRGSLTPRPRPELIVDADWIAQRLDDPGVVVLDARSEAEYVGTEGGMGGRLHAGHIPGAGWLSWESLVEPSDSGTAFLPVAEIRSRFERAGAGDDRTLVAYCVIGTRASLLHFVGRMLGYDVRFYEGSWQDWGARDLPFVSGPGRR